MPGQGFVRLAAARGGGRRGAPGILEPRRPEAGPGPQAQPPHAAVKGERDHSRTETPRERDPGDDASARLVRNRDIPARDEASARHREEVQDPVARAAADEGLPVPGKGYAAEGLVDR